MLLIKEEVQVELEALHNPPTTKEPVKGDKRDWVFVLVVVPSQGPTLADAGDRFDTLDCSTSLQPHFQYNTFVPATCPSAKFPEPPATPRHTIATVSSGYYVVLVGEGP